MSARALRWGALGLLAASGCTSRAAWNHDESERIAEVMQRTPLESDEVEGLAWAASPPMASGVLRSPGYSLDAPEPRSRSRARKPKAVKRR